MNTLILILLALTLSASAQTSEVIDTSKRLEYTGKPVAVASLAQNTAKLIFFDGSKEEVTNKVVGLVIGPRGANCPGQSKAVVVLIFKNEQYTCIPFSIPQ
jgi:hypothetical protein